MTEDYKMNRIALVTESSARKNEPMKAKEFFRGPRSKWVNNIIKYLEVSGMPDENCYFLSFDNQRIIRFDDVVNPYPLFKGKRSASEGKSFAAKILDFLLKFKEKPFVELHMGKSISTPLCKLLNEYGFSYKIFADSVPLGQKPLAYEELIAEEEKIRKVKEIRRGSWRVIQTVSQRTPIEARKILEEYESVATLYGVEDIFQELRDFMKKHYKRNKEKKKALNEFEELMNSHPESDELYEFIKKINNINELFLNIEQFERYKSKFGSELAKFMRYKIKEGYVIEIEKNISSILFKLSVVLMKKVS